MKIMTAFAVLLFSSAARASAPDQGHPLEVVTAYLLPQNPSGDPQIEKDLGDRLRRVRENDTNPLIPYSDPQDEPRRSGGWVAAGTPKDKDGLPTDSLIQLKLYDFDPSGQPPVVAVEWDGEGMECDQADDGMAALARADAFHAPAGGNWISFRPRFSFDRYQGGEHPQASLIDVVCWSTDRQPHKVRVVEHGKGRVLAQFGFAAPARDVAGETANGARALHTIWLFRHGRP